MTNEKREEVPKERKFNASELADALGYNVHEFNALVQLKAIKYDDEVTEKELRKIYKKHFGGE